ncbi:MAG: HEAT repeat domain-containing protein [Chloroflexi bacterium]|nr:HEAT repeat domain-containing protein [Chloroflexota bacterium]
MPLFKPSVAELKAKRDTTGLVQELRSKDRRARVEAIQALGELRAASALAALASFLLAPTSSLAEQVEVSEALGKIGGEPAIEPLRQALAISRERERVLIDGVANETDRRYSIEFYINRIATDEYLLRAEIATALGCIGGMRAFAALIEMLADETGAMASHVKRAATDALNGILASAAADFVPALCAALDHQTLDVRAWAAERLRDYGDVRALDVLIAAMRDESEQFLVRTAAMACLGKFGDERALASLEELMQAGNRNFAVDAKHAAMEIRQRLKLDQRLGIYQDE